MRVFFSNISKKNAESLFCLLFMCFAAELFSLESKNQCKLNQRYSYKPKIFLNSINVIQNAQFDFMGSDEGRGQSLSTKVLFDFKNYSFAFGTSFSSAGYDFTSCARFCPNFYKNDRLGTELIWHHSKYLKDFYENDFLLNFFSDFTITQNLNVKLHVGLFYKNAVIPSVKEYIPFFNNFSADFGIQLFFLPIKTVTLYSYFGSNTFLEYPLFFSAFINLGIEYAFLFETLSFGLEIESRWDDFVVVPKNISQATVKIFYKIKV